MKITALAPWFGSNRMLAENVGAALKGCSWVGVPFAGGMSELAHIDATTIVVSDLHRHIINLACVIADQESLEKLQACLDGLAFHPDVLAASQKKCREEEYIALETPQFEWAVDYFVSCWMGRSAKAGTDAEFKGGLPVRWSASGGDSNTRFRSAVESLASWNQIFRRCNFFCQDVFEFLGNCKDVPKNGLYLDPPFPGPGDSYKHKFTIAQHRQLAVRLAEFRSCRVVCRFYNVPLIRELYPESRWTWNEFTGRKQTNEAAPEVLLMNKSGVAL